MASELTVDPKLYRLLIEQARDYALFVLDAAGHILTWNLGAQRLKGYAPEEIIGRHFSTFYTPQAIASGWPDEELRLATREGRFEDEGWRVRKDGTRFWANVVITALRDEAGRLLGFSKITRDLTDRKMHEEALRESEERFRLLVEGVVDYAIYMLDPEGLITSWNMGGERITGYPREEILGKHFSRFYPSEDLQAGKPWQELATAQRSGRAEDEGWRVRKSGERFWARVVVTALHDTDGKLRGYAKVTQDLSERKHIQDLEKAARQVNEFIATLAHELRNPLAPIRAAVEAMARLPPGAPEHTALRETIERQSAQLTRIVDDMIDIARITRGVLTMEKKPLDMREAVHRALETVAPAVQGARHTLEVDLPPQALVVDGDVQRLTQLLANVLGNAARYTADGGRIAVRLRRDPRDAVVQVRDTGRGIAPAMMEHIFDMFVQGVSAQRRVGAGLGIGLALSRRIAEMHGGSLTAYSAGENQGSEFTLRVPLAKGSELPLADEPSAARGASEPVVAKRILVVDDNVDAATTLQLLLRSLGHEVRVAHDGPQAIRAANEFVPDVVLLDIGLPGMDGYEVARRLRGLRRARPLRIVAVTGWGQDADRARSQDAGFDVHLVKPVDPEMLERLITSDERDGNHTLH